MIEQSISSYSFGEESTVLKNPCPVPLSELCRERKRMSVWAGLETVNNLQRWQKTLETSVVWWCSIVGYQVSSCSTQAGIFWWKGPHRTR